MRRLRTPGRERVARRRQRQIQIRARRQRQLTQHLFGGRIDHWNVFAVPAADPFPANEQIQFGYRLRSMVISYENGPAS